MPGIAHIMGCCERPCAYCFSGAPSVIRAKLTVDVTKCSDDLALGLLNVEVDMDHRPELIMPPIWGACCWLGSTLHNGTTYYYDLFVSGGAVLPSAWRFMIWTATDHIFYVSPDFDGDCLNLDASGNSDYIQAGCGQLTSTAVCPTPLTGDVWRTQTGYGGTIHVWAL